MKCPNCGAEVFVKGSQWECGWCGNCGRLAPVPQPAPTVRLTILPQTQSASPTPASPKNAPAPWTSPTWQLRLKNYFAEDPNAALALWREALDAAGPQLQRSRTNSSCPTSSSALGSMRTTKRTFSRSSTPWKRSASPARSSRAPLSTACN